MDAPRVTCLTCSNQILVQTAERNGGLCGVCARKEKRIHAQVALEADILQIRYGKEFQSLRKMTRDAVREAFKDLERLCGHEQIYGIAVYAYHIAGPPVFCGSTVTGFLQREAKLRGDHNLLERLRASGISVREHILCEGKWSPYEWEYEAHCWADFQDIVHYVDQLECKPAGATTNELHSMVLAAYTACLQDLDQEGLFVKQRRDSSLILFCSDCDSSDAVWYQHASAEVLNPAELYERFYEECLVFYEAEEARLNALLGNERQRRFQQYLALADVASAGG